MDFLVRHKTISLVTFLSQGKISNIDLINNLKKEIIEKCEQNKENHSTTNVKAKFSGFESLPHSKKFQDFIKLISNEMGYIYRGPVAFKEAWGNICDTPQHKIQPHNHEGITAFCGILYLTGNGPGTFFPEYDMHIKEEVGKFVLFHPLLVHYVPETNLKSQRITLAFNVDKIKPWEKKSIEKEGEWIK